jgi:hypothetical protein
VSTGPELIPSTAPRERNWLPLAIAAGVVLIAAAVIVIVMEHGKNGAKVTPITAPADLYAVSLPLTNLVMSESGNLAGGKVTYLDGHIANHGSQTVSGITVQVLFRNAAHEVAQNETQPIKIIRTRDPYVDVEPVSAAPLKPGDERDFRLIFDAVNQDWDGVYPELKIVHADKQ